MDSPESERQTRTGNGLSRSARVFATLLSVVSLIFVLALRYRLIDTLNVHWDEFNFLRQVHVYLRGEGLSLLQTFHVHLFTWVVSITRDEVDQIMAARHAIFVMSVISAGLLAWVGYRLLGGSAGVFAAFCANSFAYVQQYGSSFRYDGLITPFYLASAAALLSRRRPLLMAAVAGFPAALAFAVSIKSALFLPGLLVIAAAPVLRPATRRAALRAVAGFSASFVAFSASLLFVHGLTLGIGAGREASRMAARAAGSFLVFGEPLPRWTMLARSLDWDRPAWLLLAAGFALLAAALRRGTDETRVRTARALALALPLASLLFYRNAWPYFYASLLPGAAILAGAVWSWLDGLSLRRPAPASVLVAGVSILLSLHAWSWFESNDDDQTGIQRAVVSAVHEIFPAPVPYMDRAGMIASFPKVGPFMSTETMKRYRRQGKDVMRALLEEGRPKFLVADVDSLELQHETTRGAYAWRPDDYRLLRENFLHQWGPIWIAGKALTAQRTTTHFEVLIPGTYTLVGTGDVEIDGRRVRRGDGVLLARGEHRLRSPEGSAEPVTLRWGEGIRRPSGDPPSGWIFRGFFWRRPRERWSIPWPEGGTWAAGR